MTRVHSSFLYIYKGEPDGESCGPFTIVFYDWLEVNRRVVTGDFLFSIQKGIVRYKFSALLSENRKYRNWNYFQKRNMIYFNLLSGTFTWFIAMKSDVWKIRYFYIALWQIYIDNFEKHVCGRKEIAYRF